MAALQVERSPKVIDKPQIETKAETAVTKVAEVEAAVVEAAKAEAEVAVLVRSADHEHMAAATCTWLHPLQLLPLHPSWYPLLSLLH